MATRDNLLDLFAQIPSLNSKVLGDDRVSMPKMKGASTRLKRSERSPEVTSENFDSEIGDAKAIDRVFKAIRKAASKREFTRTNINLWRSSLVFHGDRCVRRSRDSAYRKLADRTTLWADGMPINQSMASANHWFVQHLIPRLRAGGNPRHSLAVIGAPGSGKSTLTKYLISENSDALRKSKIVVSRFEFLKFWKEWRSDTSSLDTALANYLSFIHARDLILDHFFDFKDGDKFELKFQFRRPKDCEAHLAMLQRELDSLASLLGHKTGPVTDFLLTETFAAASNSNKSLMEWLRNLPTSMRILLIGVFWETNCLVTVFDGLDSLRIEDAFQKTKEWDAIVHIISNRQSLSAPTDLRRIGKTEESNSIVVMRSNTAAFLEYEFAKRSEQLGIQQYYELGNLHGLAAILSVVERAAELLPEVRVQSAEVKAKFVYDFMRVIQRTMIAIWRGHGPYAKGRTVYEFFDGNLRELFGFIERVFVWTVRQMLSSDMLESDDYWSSNAHALIKRLASDRGTAFLTRKSYRIVEVLLFDDGLWFENSAGIVTTKGHLLGSGPAERHVVANSTFSGHVDNVFNYIDRERKASVDGHALLEKIRIIQICSDKSISEEDLERRLQEDFGYQPSDLPSLLRFLLKTNFIEAHISRADMTFSVYLSATTRGRLCVSSLLKNLSYLEHVFHKTLLPEVLIEKIEDDPRDSNSLLWAARSIRNAFILLCYFNHIEKNPASGVVVPQRYRLYESVQSSIVKSLERMTRPGASPQGALESSKQAQNDASWICSTAVEEIRNITGHWKKRGLLPA